MFFSFGEWVYDPFLYTLLLGTNLYFGVTECPKLSPQQVEMHIIHIMVHAHHFENEQLGEQGEQESGQPLVSPPMHWALDSKET